MCGVILAIPQKPAFSKRPIMETGIQNLTENEAPALVHFADGQTQQWLLVHVDDTQAPGAKK